jgi:hypothetical protein
MTTHLQLCGPGCTVPDLPHREPEPDWIGDHPVMHGESETPVPGTGGWNGVYTELPDAYCLCGHPIYFTCPHWLDGGIFGMTIERTDDQ